MLGVLVGLVTAVGALVPLGAAEAAETADAPLAPVITSNGPYVECTADGCLGKGGPGVPGSFTFTPNPADIDVSAYRWRLLTTAQSHTVDGSTVTLDVTPSTSGLQVLTVEAGDGDGHWGIPQEFSFAVAPPARPVGRWHFDDGVAGSGVTVAADSTTGGTPHDATLYTAGSDWSEMARRGDLDQSLWLNDTADPARQAGYAATDVPAVDTGESFTVSTWVYLTDATRNHVAVSALGSRASAFALYYSAGARKWIFNRADRDVDQPLRVRSSADTANPPLNVWTHLAGVFDTHGDADPDNDTIQLFVNGRPQGQPVVAAQAAATYQPWASTEGTQFGRFRSAGVYGEHFRGRLDEVQVWQRALGEGEVREESGLLSAPSLPGVELVASWDATGATGTQIPESSPYPVGPMTLSATGAVLDEENDALVLDGTSGYASTTGPVVDETNSFTVTARVRLDSAQLLDKPVGHVSQIVGQRSGEGFSWALQAVKLTVDDVYWRFVRSDIDASGQLASTAGVWSDEPAGLDTWVQVTGAFDSTDEWVDGGTVQYGRVRLAVAQFYQTTGVSSRFAAVEQGAGELALGRGGDAGTAGDYLPGALHEVRVWAGAMTEHQISALVLGAE